MNMGKIRGIIWGIVLVLIGIVVGIYALGIWDFNLFFDGWWTLLIIIPCFVFLITERQKLISFIGLCVGVFLLLCSLGILEYAMIWKLGIPLAIIIIGVRMICRGAFKNKSERLLRKIKKDGIEIEKHNVTFANTDVSYADEDFYGAEFNAIFGGVTCDLRTAIIDDDCVINATSVFGRVEILIPEDVNVKVHSITAMGNVSNKKQKNILDDKQYTIYVNAISLFGRIDIK